MTSPSRRRKALALYVVLLVLPTAVLGGLHWHQLALDQEARLAAAPAQVRDAAQRLVETIQQRLDALLELENRRGFEQYREEYFPRHAIGASLVFFQSPLAHQPPPEGILCWFRYNLQAGPDAPFELFRDEGALREGWSQLEPGLAAAVGELIEHDWRDGFFRRITRASDLRIESVPLSFAAVNASPERDVQCLLGESENLALLARESVLLRQYDFHLRFYREPDGSPRLIATRPVRIDGHRALRGMSECFEPLREGATIMQGFFLDPAWLFGELPLSAAAGVLDGSLQFVPANGAPLANEPDRFVSTIRLVDELGFETYDDSERDFGALQVAISTKDLKERYQRQTWRFLGVVVMLALTLGTGLVLLLRSVRRDLEQADRTENFVAAVTHELRTPVSAIRLYGEMLRDGWASEPEKRASYYERIVSEAERLETMVERVLEKAQLRSKPPEPIAADLNSFLEPVVGGLMRNGQGHEGDLALELGRALPPVLLTAEALSSIVVNLVENARKYAPVPPPELHGGHAGEPILVRTLRHRGAAALEVLDRGPGIPPEERQRVFEAFYRIGDESRRRARGTGLGLHLVQSHAQALGGYAEVVDRPGGGSLFRVVFRRAAPVQDP